MMGIHWEQLRNKNSVKWPRKEGENRKGKEEMGWEIFFLARIKRPWKWVMELTQPQPGGGGGARAVPCHSAAT